MEIKNFCTRLIDYFQLSCFMSSKKTSISLPFALLQLEESPNSALRWHSAIPGPTLSMSLSYNCLYIPKYSALLEVMTVHFCTESGT